MKRNMPDQFDRHGRPSGWDWPVSQPPRSQTRAAAAAVGESGGGKWKNVITPKKECTASADGMHHGEAVLPIGYGTRKKPAKPFVCEWKSRSWRARGDETLAWWSCHHIEYCTECGNKMEIGMGSRCPSYPGSPEQKASAEQKTLELEAKNAAAPIPAWRKKKIPNGRQSFRRKKGGA
jgi:hypothetical protein